MGVVVAVLAIAVGPAHGANQTVVIEDVSFVPARVAVKPGETVTWNNPTTGEEHNVHFEDNAFVGPPIPRSGPWIVNRTFAADGTNPFYCEIHGRVGGIGMSGVVYVNALGIVPPVAAIELSARVAKLAEPVTFSGFRSTVGGRPIVRHQWDLDGNPADFELDTGTAATTTRSYTSPATLTVRLRVTDDVGLRSEATGVLRVTASPTASFSARPSPVQTGQSVSFDASTSTDSDGRIVRYEWDLDGDGAFETDTEATAAASRAYTVAGPVTVRLRVTDNDGVTAETTRTLQVDQAARPAPVPGPAPTPPPASAPQPQPAPSPQPKALVPAAGCSSLQGAKRAACARRACSSLKGAKRLACLRKSCRFLKGSKRKACQRQYARKR